MNIVQPKAPVSRYGYKRIVVWGDNSGDKVSVNTRVTTILAKQIRPNSRTEGASFSIQSNCNTLWPELAATPRHLDRPVFSHDGKKGNGTMLEVSGMDHIS